MRAVRNLFPGVNPHLNSLVIETGWAEFHNQYIGDLVRTMQGDLRQLGYIARSESALQIRQLSDEGQVTLRYPRADVAIYAKDTQTTAAPPPTATPGEIVLPLPAMTTITEDQAEYRAIAIYTTTDDQLPIAWVEVLSPTNMPGERHFDSYAAKRHMLLLQGIVFVEVDLLHPFPPTFANIPHDKAYRITVIDPRPDITQGLGRTRLFGVDEAIPQMMIPLVGDDKITIDFNAAYQKTFTEVYFGDRLDYRKYPTDIERYPEWDQSWIANRMIAILQTEGDLETAVIQQPEYTYRQARKLIAQKLG
jgi:hypothetical protein